MAEERPGTPGPGQAPGAPPDPSMEDILASIRRILSEDEAAAPAPGAPAVAKPAGPATEPLELTEEMLVSSPAAPPAPPPPPEPVAMAASPPPQPPAPEPTAEPVTDRSLLAPDAAAAASASVGALLRAVAQDRASAVTRGGPSIEDVVREELRPLLKEWLDVHLPPLVERLVRAEIERVVGRALS